MVLKAKSLISRIFLVSALLFVAFMASLQLKAQDVGYPDMPVISGCYKNDLPCQNGVWSQWLWYTKDLTYLGTPIKTSYQIRFCDCDGTRYYQIVLTDFAYDEENYPILKDIVKPYPGTEYSMDGIRTVINECFKTISKEKAAQEKRICPNTSTFTMYWPGACAKTCVYQLAGWVGKYFHMVTCNDNACCGRTLVYCYQNSSASEPTVSEYLESANFSCPAQTGGNLENCTLPGDTFNGKTVISVEGTACSLNCVGY